MIEDALGPGCYRIGRNMCLYLQLVYCLSVYWLMMQVRDAVSGYDDGVIADQSALPRFSRIILPM